MQNLFYVKSIVLLNFYLEPPNPNYIRKKNVKICKIYQNCRNDVPFNSSLRKKKLFFVFHFICQKIQKYKKRKSTSIFRFICKKYQKRKKPKSASVFRFSFYAHKIWLPVTHYPTYVWINEVSLWAGPEHPWHTLRTPLKNSLTGENPRNILNCKN